MQDKIVLTHERLKKILDKIKKCLALSTSSNSNEASTALRQAQALMSQYNVDDGDLHEVGHVVIKYKKSKKVQSWEVSLINMAGDIAGCEVLLQTGASGCSAIFIGIPSKREMASYVFEVLHRQISQIRRRYMKENLTHIHSSYQRGRLADVFCGAVVHESARKVSKVINPEKEGELVQKYRGDLITPGSKPKNVKFPSINNRDDYNALHSGLKAGKDVNIYGGVNRTEQAMIGGVE